MERNPITGAEIEILDQAFGKMWEWKQVGRLLLHENRWNLCEVVSSLVSGRWPFLRARPTGIPIHLQRRNPILIL